MFPDKMIVHHRHTAGWQSLKPPLIRTLRALWLFSQIAAHRNKFLPPLPVCTPPDYYVSRGEVKTREREGARAESAVNFSCIPKVHQSMGTASQRRRHRALPTSKSHTRQTKLSLDFEIGRCIGSGKVESALIKLPGL
jgi:hypothetical protein